eukprot:2346614-Pleurochrysis_carterae.AAC.1
MASKSPTPDSACQTRQESTRFRRTVIFEPSVSMYLSYLSGGDGADGPVEERVEAEADDEEACGRGEVAERAVDRAALGEELRAGRGR